MRAALSSLAVVAVYFAAAKLGLSLAFVAAQVSPVWPPAGIALAVLLLDGRLWPGVALGAFLANATAHEPIGTAVGIALGNTLEAVFGAWLLRRGGIRTSFERLRDVLTLIVLAALGSTMVSATVGVTSLCLGGVQQWAHFSTLWWIWWLGDAMGVLVMAPVLLVWLRSPPRRWAGPRLTEASVMLGGLVAVSAVIFTDIPAAGAQAALQYAVFPFVIWAALRFGQRGTVTVTFVASALAIASTVNGVGPLATGSLHERLVMLQLYLAVVGVTGLLLGAAIMERNAAERHRAADLARVQVSEERLRLALEAGRMGVWDWNIRTGTIQTSDNLPSIHGLVGGTVESFRELIHPDDRAGVDEAMRNALTGGTPYDVEFRTVSPDGQVRWVAGSGETFRDPSGTPVRMVGVALDVTERKRLEEDLRAHARRLADADRRKDEFLAVLAHELRNPLAPIRNAVELLESRASDPAMVERARGLIQRQVAHMVRLVDDLLEVSRITSGKIQLRKEIVDLEAVVDAAVETSRPLLDARRHELSVDLPSVPVQLEADPVRLTQILANLLHNAAKFTPGGGRVWLMAERIGAEVLVCVRDSGIDMPTDVLARAFEPFVQGDPSLDRSSGGLGIGLTLVRSLVELHGGRVVAESEGSGRGSTLTVRLPVLSSDFAATDASPPPLAPAATPRRVLVVDDNVDTAETLAMLLQLDGHTVHAAHSGPAAVEAARAFVPDVVVLDIGLPGMDGYAVARALRADPRLGGCRLIALSGYGREEDRRQALDAGFDQHLVKPVELDVLRGLLGSLPETPDVTPLRARS